MAGELQLDTPVQFAPGVGPTRAAQLAELGVQTVEDLLHYFPRRFDLRRQAQPIASLRGDEEAATVAGAVVETRWVGRHPRPFFEFSIDDGAACMVLRFYHGGYLRDKIRPGLLLAASGPVKVFREAIMLINPRLQVLHDAAGVDLSSDELLPVYPAGGRLSSGVIAHVIQKALPRMLPLVPEWLDRPHLSDRGLMDRPSAVAAMHRPEDTEQWQAARRRMAYDECLLMQLAMAMVRARAVSRPAHPLPCSPEIDARIRARFPFDLTAAQNRAVAEIAADLAKGRPMNRLLQGDVGAGKTVVALHAALLAVAHGKQAVIMAPTEILAAQHYRKIARYLEGSRVRTELLVGGQPAKQRETTLADLAAGDVHLVVGTHALLGEKVRFARLALVIVDEQHKFGVQQRGGIRGKGHAPHYLVMTATPIPRTLAMTVFGDLDVSVIDELPPGRGKTATRLATPSQMKGVLEAVAERLDAGQQAYFIYPLVSASDKLDLRAAQDAYEHLRAGELGRHGVGLIHGQMSAAEKEDAMRRFAAGEVRLLVASVVVEVGIDVPNANVMVVEHAERFGLAQLHQLRGRIGRGKADALCVLVTGSTSPLALERLDVLCKTTDGFKIAEEDLRLRGPGEFFGTRQHGLPELKVADLSQDFELLRLARRDAFAIIEEDPSLAEPHHQPLRRALLKAYAGRIGLAATG